MKRTFSGIGIVAALLCASAPASAQEGAGVHGASPGCSGRLGAEAVVRCALAASPEVREARARLEAIAGRRVAAGVWLPTNPVVGAVVSRRDRPPPEAASVLNWNVSLSQQIEIAGQRGARLEIADAEAAAQIRRVAVAEQEVAAAAWGAWYEAAAAREGLRFAVQLAATADGLASAAEGRAREALLSGVDADVARAEAIRIGLGRFQAEQRLTASRSALALLVGVEAGHVVVPDDVEAPVPGPLPAPEALAEQALRLRGEIAAAEAERRVLEQRLSLLRRERVPNLTLSAFAERGEINDRVLGLGLSIPVPLPAPVGRTRAGEIAETIAGIRAAESSLELVRRRVRLEVARAAAAHKARTDASALFAGDLLARARADLGALREGIASRQMSLREALIAQRSLIELLQADIEHRLARALAWVDLRRVAGIPLVAPGEGGR
jgi:cobalt-zinc-cadmium efflux system outer membrane protein